LTDEYLVETQPIVKCPEGYVVHGEDEKYCLNYKSKPFNLKCTTGTTVHMHDGEMSCFELREETPTYECGPGWTARNAQSIPGQFQHPISCTRDIMRRLHYVCPDDYEFDEATNQCVYLVKYPAIHYCEDGLEDDNKICHNLVTHSPLTRCPSGYALTKDGCVLSKSAVPVKVCPNGYKLEGQECVYRQKTKSKFVCTPPFVWNGTSCVSKVTTPVSYICDDGMSLNGTTCSNRMCKDARMECQSGYVMDGQERCFKRLTVPSTPGKNSEDCPPNYRFVGKHDCQGLDYAKSLMNCDDSYVLEGKRCCKSKQAYARTICNSGMELLNGMCVAKRQTERQPVCDVGDLIAGECVITDIKDYTEECPAGYKINMESSADKSKGEIDVLCLHFKYADLQEGCERGFFRREDGLCVEVLETPSKYRCIDGDLLPYDETHKPHCAFSTILSPKIKCPEGFHKSSSEIVPGISGSCVMQDHKEPYLVCPLRYSVINDHCRLAREVQPERYCPNGFRIQDDVCIHELTVPAEYECPFFEVYLYYNPETGFCEADQEEKQFYPSATAGPQTEELLDMVIDEPQVITVIEPETSTTPEPIIIYDNPKKLEMIVQARDVEDPTFQYEQVQPYGKESTNMIDSLIKAMTRF